MISVKHGYVRAGLCTCGVYVVPCFSVQSRKNVRPLMFSVEDALLFLESMPHAAGEKQKNSPQFTTNTFVSTLNAFR